MKVRNDFVTNSSSSSFIISKRCLDDDQIEAIRKHGKLGEILNMWCADEPWNILENDNYISGWTGMDNFNMGDFLQTIGVADRNVNWSEYPFNLPDDKTCEESIDNDSDWRKLLYEN